MTTATETTKAPASAGRKVLAAAGMFVAVAAVAALGVVSNAPHTDGWYAEANRVPWSPPNWLFGPAWTILYILIAIAGYLIWRRGFRGQGTPNAARRPLTLFIVQLVLNALWSPAFFAGYPLIGPAAWWIAMVIMVLLIACVVGLIAMCWGRHRVAAVLLLPYLAWLLFASSLNAGVIALN